MKLDNSDYDPRMLTSINKVLRRMLSTNQSLFVRASVRNLSINSNKLHCYNLNHQTKLRCLEYCKEI